MNLNKSIQRRVADLPSTLCASVGLVVVVVLITNLVVIATRCGPPA